MYEGREREYKVLLDDSRRDPQPRDRLANRNRGKDFIHGINVAGADTVLDDNLFNHLEKAKGPCCKLAKLIYDYTSSCRETYTEIMNYGYSYTAYNVLTDIKQFTNSREDPTNIFLRTSSESYIEIAGAHMIPEVE